MTKISCITALEKPYKHVQDDFSALCFGGSYGRMTFDSQTPEIMYLLIIEEKKKFNHNQLHCLFKFLRVKERTKEQKRGKKVNFSE
jgi:hypothetical protein